MAIAAAMVMTTMIGNMGHSFFLKTFFRYFTYFEEESGGSIPFPPFFYCYLSILLPGMQT
jgi:hypothetical protein